MHQIKNDYENVFIASKINKFLYNPQTWVYNRNVLISLIESHYFLEELTSEGESSEKYSNFMTYLLVNNNDVEIKNAVC
jgi:hypothetical protein